VQDYEDVRALIQLYIANLAITSEQLVGNIGGRMLSFCRSVGAPAPAGVDRGCAVGS
jgi:hypothetical protein